MRRITVKVVPLYVVIRIPQSDHCSVHLVDREIMSQAARPSSEDAFKRRVWAFVEAETATEAEDIFAEWYATGNAPLIGSVLRKGASK